MIPVFIGYDAREQDAYEVCQRSMLEHPGKELITAHPISSNHHLYSRERRIVNGIMIDSLDNKPFSTEFSFARFFVPQMVGYAGWAIFMDCDMLVRADLNELWNMRDGRFAVQVVRHDYRPIEEWKMDGCRQEVYPRKNWSSVVLWNCGHPANLALTQNIINTMPGSWLHGFKWLRDEQIGGLPEEWNWLEGWSSPDIDPKIVHYTRGGPWFKDYENVAYADEWRAVYDSIHKKVSA